MPRLLLLVLLALTGQPALASAATAADDKATLAFLAQRSQQREARERLRESYQEAKVEAYDGYLSSMAKAVGLCLDLGQRERAEQLLADMASTNPAWEGLAALRERLSGTAAISELSAGDAARIDKAVEAAVDRRTRTLVRFTNRLLEARLYGLAYDNVTEILHYDPDNTGVRRSIGEVFDDDLGRWRHAYYGSRLKDRLKWDPALGWFRYKEAERYAAGEYYDLQSKRWAPLSGLDAVHRSIDTPWVIESQHFRLHAGCDLKTALEAVNELEGLYRAWIRNFVGFFPPREAGERLFDTKAFPPLTVYLWADRDMYLEWIDQTFAGDALLQDSAGFYATANHASQFYLCEGWRSTMWHEVTHQIFGEASSDHANEIGLVEGLAVYMQDGRIDGGGISVALADNGHIRHFLKDFADGRFDDFAAIWRRSPERFHGGDRHKHYAEAGLLVFFLMQAEGGRYAADLIDYASDAYNRRLRFGIGPYCGLEPAALDTAFREWVRATAAPLAEKLR
jgi:hypothetical protein